MYVIACIMVCVKIIVKNSSSWRQSKPPNLLKKRVEEKGDVLKQYYEFYFMDHFLWKIDHTASLIKSNCNS